MKLLAGFVHGRRLAFKKGEGGLNLTGGAVSDIVTPGETSFSRLAGAVFPKIVLSKAELTPVLAILDGALLLSVSPLALASRTTPILSGDQALGCFQSAVLPESAGNPQRDPSGD
jgi:hypothetical protein